MTGRSKKKTTAAHSSLPASPAGETPKVKDSRSLKSESPTAGLNERWMVPGVCIFLAAVIWVVFGQTLGHEFVNFDDDEYIYENPVVAQGLTLSGIIWAFSHFCSSNWHPLTWISHMLDCQFYGLSPGGHHLTNILLHTTTAILLFLVLRRMTGFLWRSAFVAAVFAIHPLRVESVAWVAERKDVLSGLFFMLTIGAYVRFVQRRSNVEGRESGTQAVPALGPSTWRLAASKRSEAKMARLWTLDYGLVLLFFALGLMCKPMLVTLPLVLLLLDYWPLGRMTGENKGKPSTFNPQLPGATKRNEGGSTLLLEKLPLLGLAVASGVVTIFAQTGAIQSFENISFPLRLGNALIAYVAYLGQMFWPSGLAVLYPFTAGGVGASRVALSLLLLAGISTGVFILRRRHPVFLTGWLWYLIMLAPVIGIFQVGDQTRADRYTYLPQIGLYLLLTWAAADLCAGWRYRRVALGGSSTILLLALILCAHTQTAYWQNSVSLWTHTLACTSGNSGDHNNLGNALLQKGSVDEAIVHYQKALEIKPDFAEACQNLGVALFQKGQVDEAITYFQKSLEIKPDFAKAHNNLGNAQLRKGSVDEAITHFKKSLEINPDFAKAHNNLGNALLRKGSVDEAITHYQMALQLDPDYAEAHVNLGNILCQRGRSDEAITHWQKALQIKPDSLDVLNNLAWLLATCPDAHIRDGVQAVKYARRACELTHYGVTRLVGTLAAACAEAGRFDDAIAAAEKACALASAAGEQDLLGKNQQLLALYRAHQPHHEAAEKFVPDAP